MRPARLAPIKEPIPSLAGVRGTLRPEILVAAASAICLFGFPCVPGGKGASRMLGAAPDRTPTRSASEGSSGPPAHRSSTRTPKAGDGTAPLMWVPSLTQTPNRVSDDLALGLRARKLLLQDEVLAGQVLGVSVRNRVAILWGVVSSTSVALRAENCLRSLSGLAAIRSELSIDARSEPPRDRYAFSSSAAQSPPSRRVPGKLVHRVEEQLPTPGPEYRWRPAGHRLPITMPGQASTGAQQTEKLAERPAVESLPGFPSGDSDRASRPSAPRSVLPFPAQMRESVPVMPVLIVRAPAPVRESAAPRAPVPSAASHDTSILIERIEELRMGDDRFRSVRAEVRGDLVYLDGTVYCWDHLFDLARSISRLPGVRRVLFKEVRAESP